MIPSRSVNVCISSGKTLNEAASGPSTAVTQYIFSAMQKQRSCPHLMSCLVPGRDMQRDSRSDLVIGFAVQDDKDNEMGWPLAITRMSLRKIHWHCYACFQQFILYKPSSRCLYQLHSRPHIQIHILLIILGSSCPDLRRRFI